MLQVILAAKTAHAAVAPTLFGADQPADQKLLLDDDVHAAAADAAAKWQERINHMFGSVSTDTRLLSRTSGVFGTAVPGISHLLLADVAGGESAKLLLQQDYILHRADFLGSMAVADV